MRGWLCWLAAFSCVAACEGDKKPPAEPSIEQQRYTIEQLQDPKLCASCHPRHYDEWASSMHAYAADDPVFIAMNKRGQRETQGQMGEFCVQCHAPMAVRNGLTKDGLNLDQLPRSVKGVTCYFCHNAIEAGPDHFNANLKLANDQTMRGNLRNAVDPGVHGVALSEAHNNLSMKSSHLCGTCHDVVNQKGAHIERTLLEYEASTSSIARVGIAGGGDSCQGCHMRVVDTDFAAKPPSAELAQRLKKRDLHSHRWSAVDVALTEFPDRAAQRLDTECALTFGAFIFEVFHDGHGGFSVDIETNAGHAQPSGAAQDRRLWLEFIAYDANDKVLFQSGVIGDQEVEEYPLGDPKHDPQLCIFRDKFENEAGEEVHMFWEAAQRNTKESVLIPYAPDALSNHVHSCKYTVPGRQQPARVTMRMRMRPVSMYILNDLVDSGDLDAAVLKEMPTFTLHNTVIEWRDGDPNPLSRPTPETMTIDCP